MKNFHLKIKIHRMIKMNNFKISYMKNKNNLKSF